MNFKKEDSSSFFSEFIELLKNSPTAISSIIGFAPPFTILDHVGEILKLSSIKLLLGSQNIHWLNSGSHTGEISPIMLQDLGVNFSIIGHSERREWYGETDEKVSLRTISAINANITPVVCVGESKIDYNAGQSKEIVLSQLKSSLNNISLKSNFISGSQYPSLIVAYEPVWAIGGIAAKPEEANSLCKVIKEYLNDNLGQDVPVLYGGAVDPNNVQSLYAGDSIDGFLVGGASLKPKIFSEVITLCS